jgi:hypothetical protein
MHAYVASCSVIYRIEARLATLLIEWEQKAGASKIHSEESSFQMAQNRHETFTLTDLILVFRVQLAEQEHIGGLGGRE